MKTKNETTAGLPSAFPPVDDARALAIWLAQLWQVVAELKQRMDSIEAAVKKLEEE